MQSSAVAGRPQPRQGLVIKSCCLHAPYFFLALLSGVKHKSAVRNFL